MNASVHARISCRAAKTTDPEDYTFFENLHSFMDCSKEVESSNLHRALTHHLHFVRRIVLPIFGATRQIGQKIVSIKDDMEANHILADFRGRFIPSLSDYAGLIEDAADDEQRFKDFRSDNQKMLEQFPEVEDILVSPLYNTGLIKSLWLTHNSWYIGEILPHVFSIAREIRNFGENAPSIFFNRMRYADWVQNGNGAPPSFAKIQNYHDRKLANKTRKPEAAASYD